jgi:hypothetical protein
MVVLTGDFQQIFLFIPSGTIADELQLALSDLTYGVN